MHNLRCGDIKNIKIKIYSSNPKMLITLRFANLNISLSIYNMKCNIFKRIKNPLKMYLSLLQPYACTIISVFRNK